jgi:diphosphomevalonate decarboxylase
MSTTTATGVACANIAFIKYWGNRDGARRLPANGSISMNLDGLATRTTVSFQPSLPFDEFILNGHEVTGHGLARVSAMLDETRDRAGISACAEVVSENNFPTGAGIASSAAAFAALALAASRAAGMTLSEAELSRFARHGSGSACRSVPAGFVEWKAAERDEESFAISLAPPDHWNLADCIAVVSAGHKSTGSTEGHALADTSPLQAARVADAPRRLDICRQAILARDFQTLATIAELDSGLMHSVMMTSEPPLFYWQPATLAIMDAVRKWRESGLPAFYTIDAGPNVHVICEKDAAEAVIERLHGIEGVINVLCAGVGGPACLAVD